MDKNIQKLIKKTKDGFKDLKVHDKYKKKALGYIEKWLSEEEFKEYLPQITHIINSSDWDYLLDCFYQIIPFGTGGRRGEVGVGPNRINKLTIQSSAQGHSQYLIRQYGQEAKKRGVVLSYGIREFFTNKHLNEKLPNPVRNLKGKDLAHAAAEVYPANGIKVYLFKNPRTTPELSFAIRYLNAVAGDMFDASHNPPEHNGKKVYDEFGGQLIPPDDEALVKEVTEKVKEIKKISMEKAKKNGLLETISEEVDDKYIEEVIKLSLSKERNIKIVFTPLHGVGSTSVQKSLEKAGFEVLPDPKTSYPSGKFENIIFNIPNPEVIESFDTTLDYAKEKNADILLNSDPDADRIGVMVKHKNKWRYLNGNEIGAILMNYVIEKRKDYLDGKGVVIKTSVTTNLATMICEVNNVEIIGDLPVGFKYIGDEMNKLEKQSRIKNLLFGLEESHGYIAGNYLRDKDAAIAGLWLSELASELKKNNYSLLDYLNQVYSKYGYFRNYLTEIRLPGAEGMEKIQEIQNTLRDKKPKSFGRFQVKRFEDFWERKPIVSDTDRLSKNVLIFHFKPDPLTVSMKVTVRPSGTEPKIKMYFEIGTKPSELLKLKKVKKDTEILLKELEKSFMMHCYKILKVDFPDRGFLLFWQLPLKDKLQYFKIEPEIEKLKDVFDSEIRKKKLYTLLEFLGSDPIDKIDKAFKAKNKKSIKEYLELK